jgi:hypothetical protein
LAQVVRGDVWGVGWSENVEAWALSERPNTLVLRFEDLVTDHMKCIELLAEFVGIKMLVRERIDFSELQSVAPSFFRKGSNTSNIAELEASCAGLFWSLHGKTMMRLGYVGSIPDHQEPSDVEELSRTSQVIDLIRPHIKKIIPSQVRRSIKYLWGRSHS